jgi:hypothetical protein
MKASSPQVTFPASLAPGKTCTPLAGAQSWSIEHAVLRMQNAPTLAWAFTTTPANTTVRSPSVALGEMVAVRWMMVASSKPASAIRPASRRRVADRHHVGVVASLRVIEPLGPAEYRRAQHLLAPMAVVEKPGDLQAGGTGRFHGHTAMTAAAYDKQGFAHMPPPPDQRWPGSAPSYGRQASAPFTTAHTRSTVSSLMLLPEGRQIPRAKSVSATRPPT